MARYLLGIDLGTTNSALAYIDLQRKVRHGPPEIQTFAVPQLVALGELANRPLLPSFIYLPGEHDLPPGAAALPWNKDHNHIVGEFARNHGSRVPGRLVASAKSWLCHAGVDRKAALLPWSAPPDVHRISPVEASARYLRHLVESWNHVMAGSRPEDELEKQIIILTVPASFDDVARNLTVEAARQAGLENLTLVEEPQAAFYCWLAKHSAAESVELKAESLCLVIDVGGGTSDFSLIQAVAQQGELGFVRQAVGDHLLLGGDNMDLALAKSVESKLPGAGRLDAAQYGMLTQSCRIAKETLLGSQPPAHTTVTVFGRGRQVVGGTLHASLTPEEVRQTLFEGFFPQVVCDSEPARGARTGLHEMGLPYVNDPAITRHLASFLKKQAGPNSQPVVPQAILFNGGVFQPAALRERLVNVMRQWYDSANHPWQPLILTNPSLDLAVAWGASYYGWLRHTGGRRIGGGIARSYYIAVEGGDTNKSTEQAATLLCVVPRRLEEGQEIALTKPELELAIGQPVLFPLFTSTVRGDDHAGDVLRVAPEQLRRLPPLHTILRGGKRSGTKNVPVTLAARCTEIGTLELWCVAKEGGNRWRLEFNVRDIIEEESDKEEDLPMSGPALSDVWPEVQVQAAGNLIRTAFTEPNATEHQARDLTKDLEKSLETPRYEWPTGLCRRLWEFLSEVSEQRKRSPAHLSRWYHLTGYCLRPGFGDPLDKYRVEQLWKMINAPPRAEPGRAIVRIPESGADYWIMWRRVAGGLNSSLQNSLFDRLRPALLPGKGKNAPKPSANELAEMWRAVASLERLDPKQKELLGAALLKQARRSPVPTYAFWAITRLGNRVLLYGPLNAVVHQHTAHHWIDALLPFKPGNDSELMAWAFCLAGLARKSGQRALDVDDSHRQSVLTTLNRLKVPHHWAKMVEEQTELEGGEQSQLFGESLPIGLRLSSSSD
jgi:hypothetical protein